MASGAQLSEAGGGFVGEFDVPSTNQVIGEVEEVVTGGEIGVASANELVDGTERVGVLSGVFPTNQAAAVEIGAGHTDQVIEEAGGLGGANGMVSAVQVTKVAKVGGFDGEIEGASDKQLTSALGGMAGEIGVASVDQIMGEPEGLDGNITVGYVDQFVGEPEGLGGKITMASEDQIMGEPEGLGGKITMASAINVKGEAGASQGKIRGTYVNHETKEAGASGADIREVSGNHITVEPGASGGQSREVPLNKVTEEPEATGSEIEVFSASQASGDPAGMGGEVVGASADIMNETGGENGKIEIASEIKVNQEPGGAGGEVGVTSTMTVNGKPEGQIGGIGIASANQVNGEPGEVGGESGVTSTNQMNAEPGGMCDENGVASTNQENVEPGSVGGESCMASANQMIRQPEGKYNSFEVASANQMNGQPGGEGSKFGVASANQMNGQPGGSSGEIWLAAANQLNEEPLGEIGSASANQVNGQPEGSSGEMWLASGNQLNEEPVGEIGPAPANQVNEKPVGKIGSASANQVNKEPGDGGGKIWVPSSNPNGVSGRVDGELGVEEKHRWVETKVYHRRSKGEKNKGVLNDTAAASSQKTIVCNGNGSQNNKTIEVSPNQSVDGSMVVETAKNLSVPASGDITNLKLIQHETVGEVISNKGLTTARLNTASLILVDPPVTNGALRPPDSATDRKVKIKLASTTKPELQELKRKFENELYSVRKAVKRMDGYREEVVREFFHPVVNSNMLPNGVRCNGFATQVYSGTRSLGHVPYKPNIRHFNQLSVSVVENGHGMVDSIEREKRTPKANQFYRNSEFLLANDKFPPTESNKKSKSNGKKSSGGEFGFGVGSKVYKSCSALLEKLMKHKHGWVFNAPVDVEGLGLVDYFLIIKNPMDLGTVKAKLIKYWYKSPMEFAEDVRLTFHNAMLYNPKGHDVHIMAETLLKIFEGKWPDIEVKYLRELKMAVEPDMGYPTPTSRITNPFQSTAFPPLETRVFNRSESMPHPVNPKPRTLTPAPSFRTPALKKPKANDVNKRDMTYGEKQKLSTNLQSLPPEKLDGVIQIIKKRSTALSQNDDEIEVDIDSVDTETLWELDRFVTNYKKSLSKNRRKAELANQMRAEARQAAEKIATPQPLPPKESTVGYGNATLSLPPHQNGPAANASRSSSSSSSSSSGSSSSDSDSDSSSEESDGGRSPGT